MTSSARRTPITRPKTARPQADAAQHDEPAAPSDAELETVEAQLVWLAELLGANAERDDALGGLRVTWPDRGPAFNYLAVVRWSEEDWSERLATLSSRARATGGVPAVVVAAGRTTPAGLEASLTHARWTPLVEETALWTRRAAIVPHLDRSMRIEAVTEERAGEYEAAEREIFAVSPFDANDRIRSLHATISAGEQRAYLVRVGREPVATARLAARDGVAALHGIGVLPRWRRRGYGSLITTVATRAALATGNKLVWLSVADVNTAARALYAALDYRPAFGWKLLTGPLE